MERASLELLGDQWRAAAAKLGVVAVVPFDLELPLGQVARFACLLPQFGGPRGMLLTPTYEHAAFQAATDAGYGVSVLDPDTSGVDSSDLADYIACLKDWEWRGGLSSVPDWYGINQQHAV
jgi:hypothetical protein